VLIPTHSLLAGLLLVLCAQGASVANDPRCSFEAEAHVAWDRARHDSDASQAARGSEVDAWNDYVAAKAESRRQLVTGLESVAQQANKDKAYLQRDLTYELLLTLQPDHAQARKTLGFKNRKGEWTRSRPYRTPTDKNPAKAIASLEAREDLISGHRESRVQLIDDAHANLSPEAWRSEVDALLAEDLDDPFLRKLLGQVATEGTGRIRWILAETQLARAFRDRLEGLLETEQPAALAARIDEATPRDFETQVTWSAVRRGGGLTVLSAHSAEEAERHVRLANGIWLWLPRLLGGEAARPADLRLYLMTPGAEIETLVQACPDISPTDRLRAPHQATAELGAGSRFGVFSDSEVERLERAAHWHIDAYLMRAYGLTAPPAWLGQGLRAYVSERFVGSRLSLDSKTVDRSTTGTPSWVKGMRETRPRKRRTMIQLARRMLDAEQAPLLDGLLTRPAEDFTVEDTLLAYALIAYLIEGHGPAVLDPIVRSITSGADPVSGIALAHQQRALESGLDVTLSALQLRVHEWVDEMQR
tara:strand:+ start:3255 stop:4850 length:1596 start_codon:yes stop_codon:yes gene_type:complete